jgi:predicted kinase
MKVTLMCGLHGSGKSHWVKENKTEKSIVLCKDNLREAIPVDKWNRGYEDCINKIVDTSMIDFITHGYDIILDETATTVERRKHLLDVAKSHTEDIKFEVVHIDTSINMCKERRRTYRMGSSPSDWSDIITKMDMKFVKPELEEGFDEIVVVS